MKFLIYRYMEMLGEKQCLQMVDARLASYRVVLTQLYYEIGKEV